MRDFMNPSYQPRKAWNVWLAYRPLQLKVLAKRSALLLPALASDSRVGRYASAFRLRITRLTRRGRTSIGEWQNIMAINRAHGMARKQTVFHELEFQEHIDFERARAGDRDIRFHDLRLALASIELWL